MSLLTILAFLRASCKEATTPSGTVSDLSPDRPRSEAFGTGGTVAQSRMSFHVPCRNFRLIVIAASTA
jgi:hypothetical protein